MFSGDDVRLVGHVERQRLPGGAWQGQPVRLRFHLDNAALYAFRFRGEREPVPAANLLGAGLAWVTLSPT